MSEWITVCSECGLREVNGYPMHRSGCARRPKRQRRPTRLKRTIAALGRCVPSRELVLEVGSALVLGGATGVLLATGFNA